MAYTTVLSRLSRLGRPADGEHDHRFTAREVRELLGSESTGSGDRLLAVRQVAAVPSTWTGHLGKNQAWQLGRLADRLPALVYRLASGASLDEIARGERSLTAWNVDRALTAACGCIARELNRRRGGITHASSGG